MNWRIIWRQKVRRGSKTTGGQREKGAFALLRLLAASAPAGCKTQPTEGTQSDRKVAKAAIPGMLGPRRP